jgi:hypothetical protein
MRARVTLAAVALVLVAGVAAGWFFENQPSPATTVAGGSGAYRVRVTRQGRELASFDLAGLQAIGSKSVVLQGGQEEGPMLLDVLKRAGVDEFSSVTILGAGTRDSGRLELAAADVGPDTVLDVAKRGTVKVAGPSIPKDMRVRDITEIQVR